MVKISSNNHNPSGTYARKTINNTKISKQKIKLAPRETVNLFERVDKLREVVYIKKNDRTKFEAEFIIFNNIFITRSKKYLSIRSNISLQTFKFS